LAQAREKAGHKQGGFGKSKEGILQACKRAKPALFG